MITTLTNIYSIDNQQQICNNAMTRLYENNEISHNRCLDICNNGVSTLIFIHVNDFYE